jgi:hypothetical protein
MQVGFGVDGVAVATLGTRMSYRAFTNADANIFYALATFRF